MDKIEEKIRSLTIPQLEILKALAESPHGIMDSQEIMSTTATATTTFGAYISSLKKFRIDDKSIVMPAGRTTEGMRWQLNEDLIEKHRLLEILNNMRI